MAGARIARDGERRCPEASLHARPQRTGGATAKRKVFLAMADCDLHGISSMLRNRSSACFAANHGLALLRPMDAER
jgi:hypothetical protein